MAEYKPINEQFNDSYAERGAQPSVGIRPTPNIDNVINKKVYYKENNQRQFHSNQKPKQQNSFNDGVRNIKKKNKKDENISSLGTAGEVQEGVERNVKKEYRQQPQRRFIDQKNNKIDKTIIKGTGISKKIAKIKIVRSLNKVFWEVGISLWISVQLIFVFFNIIFLASGAAISAFVQETVVDENTGWFGNIAAWAKNTLSRAVTTIAEAMGAVSDFLFGFNINEALDPMNWFTATYMILLAFFILQLLVIYLIYKLARIDPLDTNLKIGSFILCFVLYCIPIINIGPWFLLWTTGVLISTKIEG